MNKIKKSLLTVIFLLINTLVLTAEESFVIIESIMPHNLNPQTTSYSADAQVLSGLYEGLFANNPVTLEPQYAIACGYKISRDKKRWTINLRNDAKFSNGEPITAESVRFAWLELLATPEAPYASMLDIIRGAQEFRTGKGLREEVGIYATDEHTLSIYLNTPANYLAKVLCHSSFSIIHRNPTVFSGPYVLDDQQAGSLVLKKNEYYWDAANVKMDKITFVQSNDAAENAFYFNTGLVDWISGDVATDKVLNSKALQFSAEFGTSYYFFKTSAKKTDNTAGSFYAWDYPEFRNAVLEAFPWEKIRVGSVVTATTFVYPLTGYPTVEGFSYTDEIEASILMKQAREKYNIPKEQIIPLNFDISEYALSEEKETMIREALAPLGIELNVKRYPSYQYLSSVSTSNADLFCYTWIGDFADPLAFLELFHGNSSLNDSGWKNEEFDQLLANAALCSEEQRYQLLSQAENILLDSGMILPIYHPVSFNVIDLEAVGGWTVNAFDIHPLKYLYKKETKSNLPNVVSR